MESDLRRRTLLARLFFVATFVVSVIAGPVLYISSVVEDSDAFVSVADQVIAHPDVRAALAEAVTAVTFEAVAADESLAEVLPESMRTFTVPITRIAASSATKVAFELLDTDVAQQVRSTALRDVHDQIMADNERVVIDLRAVLVRTSRDLGGPTVGAGVAKLVTDTDAGRYVLAEPGSSNSQIFATIRGIPNIGAFVALLALFCLVAGVLLSPDRRRGLVVGGLTWAAGAIVSTALVSIALFAMVGSAFGDSLVGNAVADVVTSDLAAQQRGPLFFGLVVALVGLLLGNRPAAIALRALPGDLWHRRAGTDQRVADVVGDNPALVRAAIWTAGGIAGVIWPNPTLRVIITIIVLSALGQVAVWLLLNQGSWAASWRDRLGLAVVSPATEPSETGRVRVNVAVLGAAVLVLWPNWSTRFVGAWFAVVALLLAVIEFPEARQLSKAGLTEPAVVSEPKRRRWVMAGAAAMAMAGVIGVVSTTAAVEHVAEATECNGHNELCDRRIDEVVFAGSHNAMSSNDLGWDLALQDGDMVTQLDFGIRALLIDAVYWDESSADPSDDAAAEAIIETALSDDRPKPGTWLCHGFCALGATDFTSGLAEIAIWLEHNPREVLLVVVQDEISENDLMDAFAASGLEDLVHNHVPGKPFPTLGELIEIDERVLVYGENGGRADSWFQNIWDTAFSETPFTFALRSEFSCVPNRGGEDKPLFLINHWLTTGIPVREVASAVNSRDALLDRVRQCEAERGQLPTVLAVDFVQTGDLIEVVDELNGFTS